LTRYLTLFPRPTTLSDDIVGWLNTFALNFFASISANDRPAFLKRVKERLSRSIQDATVSGTVTIDVTFGIAEESVSARVGISQFKKAS
jgi:hypothetical protein